MPVLASPSIPSGSLAAGPQPTLTGDDLVLRPWQPGDVPAVRAAYADPATQRWHARSLSSDEEAAALVADWTVGWARETRADWAVARGDGVVVGRIGLKKLDLQDGNAEVAYWTVPAARGRGIAPRALEILTGWAFATGFHRLYLDHSVQNAASCAVAHKAAFVVEGTMRGSARHADGWHDMHLHARLATP